MDNLSACLQASMSPFMDIRKSAEIRLNQLERNTGYIHSLFQIIQSDCQPEVKISSSINFKNFVKRNWICDESNDDKISKDNRDYIKANIIDLILQNPPAIQKQLSEAMNIIGKNDFPDQWPTLLPQLISIIQEGNFTIINSVLQTCHSLFKRYRSEDLSDSELQRLYSSFKRCRPESRSDSLCSGIKEVIRKLARPLSQLIQKTMTLIEQYSNDQSATHVLWSSVLLICKIFLSLNTQDLPKYFKDNVTTWMTQFHKILQSKSENDGSAEVTVREEVNTKVCDILTLYASNYEEEFRTFLGTFIGDVYALLLSTTSSPRFDKLVSSALNFLCIVIKIPKQWLIFNSIVNIQQLCLQLIIPNIEIQISDQERFEENPEEYIRRDIEELNEYTRRKSSCELVKFLKEYQENYVVANFGQYIEQLLAGYASNPINNWKMKDSALVLATTISSRRETELSGVISATEFVNIQSFYKTHILPELQQSSQGNVIVKAVCIKYLMTFRSLLSPEDLKFAINMMIKFVNSESHVVHTYAAVAINKLLMVKDANNLAMISGKDIENPTTFLMSLCATMNIKGSEDNIYTMEAIMRTLSTLQGLALPSMNHLVKYLKDKLVLVVKNPQKPLFNHALIECLGLCIKFLCKDNKNFVTQFESLLCPIFNDVLVGDIEEFLPYTFQLFSLMLDQHPPQQVTDSYVQLLPSLLQPVLWEKMGNIPSLIRLLLSYLEKSNGLIIDDQVQDMVNIFQRVNTSRGMGSFGFSLITAVILYLPKEHTEKYIKPVFISILERLSIFQHLSNNETTKYIRGFLVFFSSVCFVYPPMELITLIDSIKPNLFQMILDSIIVPTISTLNMASMNMSSMDDVERKICIIGVIKMACESDQIIHGNYSSYWATIMSKVVDSLLTFEPLKKKEAHFIDLSDPFRNPTVLYQLLFVGKKIIDPWTSVTDPKIFLKDSLGTMSQRYGETFTQLYSSMEPRVTEFIATLINV